jgi:hypothetical protein
MHIYLDESGDLGWKFDAPYRVGGSSRHLTIASLVVSPDKKHLPKRLIKKLYTRFHWPTSIEKKWADMSIAERICFAEQASELCSRFPDDIRYLSITVKKEKVLDHIRRDANKLYNYMIGISLLEEMSKHKDITFLPDSRSIKVESGNSLHDYLQTQLWFPMKSESIITTRPCSSDANRNIQFSDMLSGIVQGHFEDGNSQPWEKIKTNINCQTLFF